MYEYEDSACNMRVYNIICNMTSMGVWLKHLSGEGNDNVIIYEIKEKHLDDS